MPMTQHPGGLYAPAAAGGTLGVGTDIYCWTLLVPDSPTGNLDWTTPEDIDAEVVDVVVKKVGAGGAGDTHTVFNGTGGLAITDPMDTNVADHVLVRPALLSHTELPGGSTLRVGINDGGAGVTSAEIDIYWVRT